ncbi:MAG: ABC transporter substrate-binding protein [Armatimonadetes bacterium]|nr:ABC transporter substrate-binding protein [Armatimonadota bacterium]MBI2248180.1 ABC transporter substrate-binding protein [Armatimonadota bacterium]MBI2973871.1 ABC transporter substrate-binding protein [Armatimonadota bacterium]
MERSRSTAAGRSRVLGIALLAGVLVVGLISHPTTAQQPRSGGTLSYVVSAEPPSFDAHRETTFAMLHPIRPHYNLLVKFDMPNYPKVIGDLAESWAISPDGLTYTFKIRRGVRFHDGSMLTSRDVKASFDKIIFPQGDVVSVRQATYEMVESITASDPNTVVFKVKWRSPSLLLNLASPFNWVYKADLLARDPHWYERNIMGTGPFKFVEYVRGSHWAGVRNENYWMKGRPYLDGYRALFIRSVSAQVAAVRSGQALIEFRGFSPAQRDDIMKALGDKVVVQEGGWICNNLVVFNTKRRPFDDARFRRALTLAIDRWAGSKALSQIAIVGPVGGVMRPGGPFEAPEAELVKLAGYGRDISAARAEAKKLLAEAGVPEGFTFELLNRNIQMPYEFVGIFLIDQWRQVGLNVKHVIKESGPYFADERAGNYDAAVDFTCDFMDEPDVQLHKFTSADRSPANYGQYIDRVLDQLYRELSRERDPARRLRLIRQFEKRALDEKVWQIYVLWWHRIIPHWAKLKGFKMGPAHHLDPDLQDIWLAE